MNDRNSTRRSLPRRFGREHKKLIVFLLLIALVIIAFLLNLRIGTAEITWGEIGDFFFGRGGDPGKVRILMDIRLPRAIMTLILGGALSVSGFLLQTYFSNPIAGPYILGISSGAKLTVAIVLVFITGKTGRASSLMQLLAAFAGALLTTMIIILLSRAVRRMAVLLAAGIMIGYILSAITDFLIAFADDSDIVNLHSWSQGSFSGVNLSMAGTSALIVGTTFLLVMLLSKSLDALRLGESYARSVGVNVRLCRIFVILLSSVLSACVTAFVGPVAFIGIAVPFLMRESLKTSKPLILVPASFLGGAMFCMFSDLLARQLFAPTELTISAVTSLFGAPIVIVMILGRGRRNEA